MKQFAIIGIIMFLTTSLFCQDIGISVAPTINNVFHFQFVAGGPGYKARPGFNITFDCLSNKDKKIRFGTSLSYMSSQIRIVPNINTPGLVTLNESYFNMLSVSFRISITLKNNFYFNIDPIADLQLNNSHDNIANQSGIGISPSFGKLFKISKTAFVRIEPKLWIHNIIPFSSEDLQLHLTQVGLNIGFLFRPEKDDLLND